MYLMPSKGSRVSLYFKNGDESSATAVNCIRQEGEGTENEYRKRSLRTEHQKELKLYPDRMGVISPEAHVLLDDLEGLSVRGKKSLKILSAGKVSVSGQTVTLNTGKGKLSVYHGHAEAEEDGTVVFVKDAEFHHKEDGTKADSLGDRTCLCAYEKEDYSGNEYRFRDDPVEENYDYTGLAVQVMGGLVIVGGVTLVSGGVAAAVGAGAGATMIMGATAVGGTTFVAGLAVTDLISRTEEYMKAALAGSVVGALTGAAELVPVSGLARVGVDFLVGGSGSAAGQLITEEEIDAERMFREGVLAAVMAAGARMLRGGIKANIEENADIPVEKRYRGGDGEIPRSGEEWCEYFEEKYGAENVEWLTKNGYNLYFNKKYVNANFFRNSYGIVSSASGGGVPKGKYEIPDPNDPAPIQGQNEAADFLAMKGFNIEMLPNKNGGNGYGIKATSNPDYLIEGKVFDCYTPKRGTSIRNIGSIIEKKTLSQTNNIVLNLEQSDVNVSQITKQLAEYPIDSLGQLIIIKNNQYYLLAN